MKEGICSSLNSLDALFYFVQVKLICFLRLKKAHKVNESIYDLTYPCSLTANFLINKTNQDSLLLCSGILMLQMYLRKSFEKGLLIKKVLILQIFVNEQSPDPAEIL